MESDEWQVVYDRYGRKIYRSGVPTNRFMYLAGEDTLPVGKDIGR